MSEAFRIALVAEGPTDYEVIHAALNAILSNPFIMIPLQPESTQPRLGGGWGGVLKWCYEAHQRHRGPWHDDPTLVNFDLLIIHVDVDVAFKQYSDCGSTVVTWAKDNAWPQLPCGMSCPPVSDTVDALEMVIKSWLGLVELGDRALLCLPAQSSGTWLAAALLNQTHSLLAQAECNPNVESGLAVLPKAERIKKNLRAYRTHAPILTQQWQQVKQICSQAEQFEAMILNICDRPTP
ncbi:hypothetical protein [Spirulina major]|uniref:hypothetical protein n=1 Tax=Spirulina major TaxID=270636 RepID=UPI0009349BE7|nr:hypothetical protein [Spirulina major]